MQLCWLADDLTPCNVATHTAHPALAGKILGFIAPVVSICAMVYNASVHVCIVLNTTMPRWTVTRATLWICANMLLRLWVAESSRQTPRCM